MALTWPSMTEGEWNLVKSNVTTGNLNRLKSKYKYYRTHVATGAGAPIAGIKDKSPLIFEKKNQEPISSTPSIDVYIWPEDVNDSGDTITNGIEVDA